METKKRNYTKEMEKGNYPLAIALLDAEIEKNPDDPVLLYNFAICCFQTGNYKKTISILFDFLLRFERFIERDNVYKIIIFSMIQVRDFEEALKFTDERLKINVGDLRLLSFRAHIMEKTGRTEEAIQIHKNILKIKPDYKNSLNSLAYLISIKKNSTAEEIALATDCIKKILSKEPYNAAYLDSFAMLLKKRGNIKEARRALKKALKLNPTESIIIDHLRETGGE